MDNKTINRKVAVEIGLEISEERTEMLESLLGSFNETDDSIAVVIDGNIELFDPCNDWGDAGPIMIDHNIFIAPTIDKCEHKYMTKCLIDGSIGLAWTSRFTSYNDNPLLAAMNSLLKMKDAENA